MIKPIELGNL